MTHKSIYYIIFLFCAFQNLEGQDFQLVSPKGAVPIVLDAKDPKVVEIAAGLLTRDLHSISGHTPEVLYKLPNNSETMVLAGSVNSTFIKTLVERKKINITAIQGKWENYKIELVASPFKNIKKALVVVGSDRRGTAYGLLELSRKIGVSPWEWWADVTPEKKETVSVSSDPVFFKGPSVKYRGIFLNDEDWGLQPWAALTYEPETGDIGPKTYAKIFELLLRLRANTIWPAMHSSTRPFYSYPKNKQVADDYAIVIGTSHAEPMLSNINTEWDDATMGEYRYDTNAETIKKLFTKRAEENVDYEDIYTVGMRGEHDSPMIVGEDDTAYQVKLLEKIIQDQRSILKKVKGKSEEKIPQAFVPYKEVLNYYRNGLSLPDDVTLVWPDDNYGYIRQLSDTTEQKRSGGGGVYYHTSYWGRPHDYLWLNSTSPVLLWEEMSKAYAFNSRKIWILNAGDIKPNEFNIELFLDMAWNMDRFKSSSSVKAYTQDWAAREFGKPMASGITDLFFENNRLSFKRRPEFMAWSQVEPVTQPGETEMTQTHYGDEVASRINAYQKLMAKTDRLSQKIPEFRKDAFFQLIYYPLVAGADLNLKWLYHYKNKFAAQQGRASASFFGEKSKQAYQRIAALTNEYNHDLKNGKWNHIMNMSPRYLPVFDEPTIAKSTADQKPDLGLALEGYEMPVNNKIINSFANVLPVFNAYTRSSYYVDLFLKGDSPLKWKAVPQSDWISISETQGSLTQEQPEKRVWVTIDWEKVPKGKNHKEAPLGHDYQLIPPSYKVNSAIDIISGKQDTQIGVSVYNPKFEALEAYKGFVEDRGFVSINAADYSRKMKGTEADWKITEGLGYTGNVVTALPRAAASQEKIKDIVEKSPLLEYDFYTFNFGKAAVRLQVVPTHAPNTGQGVRYAVAIDDAPPALIDFGTSGRSDVWKQNVLRNASVKSAGQIVDRAGKHTLKIWMVDPGVMLDQILIDLGGWKKSYAFPKDTVIK